MMALPVSLRLTLECPTVGNPMKEIDSTITSKGQVTIPAEVRRVLGVQAHDKITFVIGEQGAVSIKAARYPTIASLRGAAGRLKQPRSWREVRHIAHEDRWQAERKTDLAQTVEPARDSEAECASDANANARRPDISRADVHRADDDRELQTHDA